MTAPERIWAWETLNCNGQWTVADGDGVEYIRADLLDAAKREARVKELEAALTRIEAGLPAGSTLSDCRDPLWRDAYRELQRIARIALKGEKT